MMRHTAAVRRGSPTSWLIGDMPYMSYQPSDETAVRNAGRFMAETGCDSVKLEGGRQWSREGQRRRGSRQAIGPDAAELALGGFRAGAPRGCPHRRRC
jgi:hypothetical protein